MVLEHLSQETIKEFTGKTHTQAEKESDGVGIAIAQKDIESNQGMIKLVESFWTDDDVKDKTVTTRTESWVMTTAGEDALKIDLFWWRSCLQD